jgi:hypothetical protein
MTQTSRLILTLSCAVMMASCSVKEKVIAPGQNIHHDDFEYSVQNVEKTDNIGNVRAHGVFYVVKFQVENRARRVDHRWTNSIAYLIDENGTRHDNDTQAQQELNRIQPFAYKNDYVTPSGSTESTMLVFDIPKTVSQPYLQVRGSLLMGDVLDGDQYRKTKVKLF